MIFTSPKKNGLLHNKPVSYSRSCYWDMCFVLPKETNTAAMGLRKARPQKTREVSVVSAATATGEYEGGDGVRRWDDFLTSTKLLSEHKVEQTWRECCIYRESVDENEVNSFYQLNRSDRSEMVESELSDRVQRVFITSLENLGFKTKYVRGNMGEVFLLVRLDDLACRIMAVDLKYKIQIDRWASVCNVKFSTDPCYTPPQAVYSHGAEQNWKCSEAIGRVWTRYDRCERVVLLKEFDVTSPELSLFRDVDRLRLSREVLSCFFNLYQLKSRGIIQNHFCLHIRDNRACLETNWAQLRWVYSSRQPIQFIRDYYGENLALWFSFMSHYASLLRAPSIVGLTVLLIAFLRTV
eukprot:GHVN01023208.1.p1 GENE.GHVN01023208.1~~GHVN01023208.1.p1  ORF type:complete len:352 (+),score=52.23 GHVN01023208.1:353-1408(+)